MVPSTPVMWASDLRSSHDVLYVLSERIGIAFEVMECNGQFVSESLLYNPVEDKLSASLDPTMSVGSLEFEIMPNSYIKLCDECLILCLQS